MKKLLLLATFLVGMTVTSSAVLIWSDDFTGADGAFGDRATTVGVGNIDVTGTISNINNAITITPDGGSDRIEFESSAAAVAGYFTFDVSITGGPTDLFFLQMVEGNLRSTGGSPQPNFSDTVDVSAHGILNPSTITYYFNVSGSDLNYTAPDSSAQVLASGGYDYWVDNTLVNADQTQSNNGAGAPTGGVDTLILQAFNQQAGSVITIDNASLNTIVIPEPTTIALIGFVSCGLLVVRRFLQV